MIKAGFEQLANFKNQPDYYKQIAEIFNLCTVPTSSVEIDSLISTLNGALGTMAMVDYPYPTSFIEPLPAWPVNYSCTQAEAASQAHFKDPLHDLYVIAAAGNTFYNYAGQLTCLDVTV